MAKINMVITNPPEGMNSKQLFYNEVHLINEFLEPLKDKLKDYKFEGKKLDGCKTATDSISFEGGSATLELVADDYKND